MYFRNNGFNRKISSVFWKRIFVALIFVFLILVVFLVSSFVGKKNDNDDEYNETVIKTIFNGQGKSIFNVKELNAKDFKNRIILLNAYSINNFSYIFSLDLANKLNKVFGNKIVIVDVIMDDIEFDNNTIINYILKNNIERPVLNISNLNIDGSLLNKEKFFVLIDNKGIIVDTFTDDKINKDKIEVAINDLLSKKPKLNFEKLPSISLEKEKTPESFIKSLEYIKYINKIKDTNNGPYFIVSDTDGGKIYFMTINGNIVDQLGGNIKGDSDGVGTNASFCGPAGIAIKDQSILYVVDTCNNSIREVDLKTMAISTLISDDDLLENPIDIAIMNDELIISTISNNPLLAYNLNNKTLSKIKCDVCDGYVLNLNKFDKKIYFLSNNGLNIIDSDKNITKKFDFAELKNDKNIKINSNNNFHIDDTGVYLADKFENRIIRIYDNNVIEYSKNNDKKIYNLPTSIIDLKDKLYITNENDKKLIKLDKNTKNTELINITFGYEYNKIKSHNDQFLDVNNLEEIVVKNGSGNKIYLDLKNGYSFEKMAPQSLSLYKEDAINNVAVFIKSYAKSDILKNNILDVPTLDNNSVYYLRGKFYYCNFDKKTPCLIKNYNKKLVTNSNSNNKDIIIKFLY